MGLTCARVSLANPRRPELDPIEVDALADTGALHLCTPEHIAIQLLLDEQEKREITIADGSKHLVFYVGPVTVGFGKRRCFTGAMVLGTEPLLGAIPMEGMDLVVLPGTRTAAVNPASPNFASSVVKTVRAA